MVSDLKTDAKKIDWLKILAISKKSTILIESSRYSNSFNYPSSDSDFNQVSEKLARIFGFFSNSKILRRFIFSIGPLVNVCLIGHLPRRKESGYPVFLGILPYIQD